MESTNENPLFNIARQYLGESDWEVKENANENISFANFIGYYIDKTWETSENVTIAFGEEVAKAHYNREIHIHKLPFSLFIPYCSGWNYQKLLEKGLVTPTVTSKPAKHLDSAVNQLINFFFLVAQEWTGACAVSAFDLHVAPFVKYDNKNEKEIKQILQTFLFELNYPTRFSYQSPFTNITVLLDTVPKFLEDKAIVGGKEVGRLGDYLDEAIKVVNALCELYLEGDGKKQPFTFPIPTLYITKDFDWNGSRWGELTDKIFEVLAKRGTFYILNGYASDIEAILSMCCRLNVNMEEAYLSAKFGGLSKVKEELLEESDKKGHAFGTWAVPDATGSIGVVSLNLVRLAIVSDGDENKFFDLLYEKLVIARKCLQKMRERYEKSMVNGLMPLSKFYLGHLFGHFNTFGLVGLPEAVANLINPNLWIECKGSEVRKAVNLMKKIVKFVREYAEYCKSEEGILYNVEEVPAESLSYRFAKADYELFKDKVEIGEVFMPRLDGVPFYSNSIIPYYVDIPIHKRVEYEGEVQQEFTGGVMMHLFLNYSTDPETLKNFIKNVCRNTKVVYFSITPTISVCKKCGFNGVGIYENCPECGEKCEVWSRIVGYYRPVKSWNIGKKVEFKMRKRVRI